MKLPWFKCEPGPLLGALAGLDPDQKLLYVIILLRIYEVGGPVKDNDDALSNRCGLTLRRTKIAIEKLTAKGKIERTEDGLLDSQTTHERLLFRKELGNVRKTFGKSGAKKRWQKTQQNQQNVDSKPIANGCRYKIEDIREEGLAKANPNRAREGTAFDRFWSIWPNKVQRTYAEKCFAKVAKEVDQIVVGVERYIREKPPDRQWLNPSTYLNQRRWEDHLPLPINGNSHGQRNGKNSLVDAADDLVEKIRLRKMRSGECGDISGTVIPLLPRL